MKRWKTTGVLAVAAALTSVAACSGGGSAGSRPTDHLTVWMMTGGPGDNKNIDDVT
jgi:N,N'-diacetylchitobiose transport system substrate-binding protein